MFIKILFIIIMLTIMITNPLVSIAVSCSNTHNGYCDQVYVESIIYGKDPSYSTGEGIASGGISSEPECSLICVESYLVAEYETATGYYDSDTGVNSLNAHFYSGPGLTGDFVQTYMKSFCEGTSAGSIAF